MLNEQTIGAAVGEVEYDEGVDEHPEKRGDQYDSTIVELGARQCERRVVVG